MTVYGLRDKFGRLGFSAQSVQPLGEQQIAELARKFARRYGLHAEQAEAVLGAVLRREYQPIGCGQGEKPRDSFCDGDPTKLWPGIQNKHTLSSLLRKCSAQRAV